MQSFTLILNELTEEELTSILVHTAVRNIVLNGVVHVFDDNHCKVESHIIANGNLLDIKHEVSDGQHTAQ